MKEAIKINNLTKSYGSHVVLNGLDFCVQQGEIFALLGINGAGKTTSLECIEGLRKYDSGSIAIFSNPVYIYPPLLHQCHRIS